MIYLDMIYYSSGISKNFEIEKVKLVRPTQQSQVESKRQGPLHAPPA